MRLTLRTLLAWLDDQLDPAEVRQIGRQVSESTFAQELIDRMYRVTRQRRLLVPPSTGADATDPNVVAAYLGDELSPEEVAEYEKKCLVSDVNLAEVASTHQILSLIGQKAKVPPEARHRMYRLVKGREGVVNRPARDFPKPAPAVDAPTTVSWAPPEPAKGPLSRRLGFSALVAGLLILTIGTAVLSLIPESPTSDPALVRPAFAPQVVMVREDPTASAPVGADPAAGAPAAATTTKAAAGPGSEATAPAPALKPTGDPIKLVRTDGVVLVWDAAKESWDRLAESATLRDGARVLNLAPFHSTLQVEGIEVHLIGDTVVTVSGRDATASVRLAPDHGRLVVKGGGGGLPYRIQLDDRAISVAPAPGASVGVDRPASRPADAAPLSIAVGEGEATLQVGETKQTVQGPATVEVSGAGGLKVVADRPVAAWVGDPGPSPSEKQLADRYLKTFSPKGQILRDLVQAVDGDDVQVRSLAILGIGAVGDAEMIVPVLNNATTDPASRQTAVEVLRAMLLRGGKPAADVRAELAKVFGQEWAGLTEKLLVGTSSDEARRESTYTDLVRMLTAPELGTRELAIQALMTLTGRDALEYDPLKPEGRGLKAWQDLLHKKELAKPVPAATATPPTPAR